MCPISGNMVVDGHFSPKTMDIPANTIVDADVASNAALEATKLRHQHRQVYAKESGTVAVTERFVVHVARGAGTVELFEAGSVTLCTVDATITVDLLKNGATVLSSTFVLDTGNTARVAEVGTLDAAKVAYIDGDVFEMDFVAAAAAGVLGDGSFGAATFHEDAE